MRARQLSSSAGEIRRRGGSMNARHMEWFGPDLGRGPFSSQRIETSALQIATALAQMRAPLTRSDDDLRTHADFIRELADKLAPDWAAQVTLDVGSRVAGVISTSIRVASGSHSLLDCWLADAVGGGLTGTAPSDVTFTAGQVLETIEANKRYLIVTPSTGVVQVSVSYLGLKSWYWTVSRNARVYYSSQLYFV
jgi:hypothetical protein